MKVHLVITGSQIRKNVEAVFSDASLAAEFAREFSTGRVQEFVVYDTMPKIYKYEVWVEKDTGDIVETNETTPYLGLITTETSDGLLYALGSSPEEAEQLAEDFRQGLFEDSL